VIAAAVSLAAIVDLAFCGYRAAAGRNARIEKTRYYARALAAGAGTGALIALVLLIVTLSVDAIHPVYTELTAIGARFLVVIAGYVALVGSALATYLLARHEVRTLATVAILGPFTLGRPVVIVGAALVGLGHSASWPAVALTLGACGTVVCGEAWLERRYRGRALDDT
jgi:hypothetical protein